MTMTHALPDMTRADFLALYERQAGPIDPVDLDDADAVERLVDAVATVLTQLPGAPLLTVAFTRDSGTCEAVLLCRGWYTPPPLTATCALPVRRLLPNAPESAADLVWGIAARLYATCGELVAAAGGPEWWAQGVAGARAFRAAADSDEGGDAEIDAAHELASLFMPGR